MQHNRSHIREKFLNRNDLFGVQFNDGIVFLEVDGYEDWSYKPYTQVGSVGANSESGFQRLNDSNNDDILYIESGEKKVLHVGIGQLNGDMRRYTNYPEGQNRLRTPPNLNVPRPSNGDDYGYVDGEDSPYQEPSDAEELIIIPGKHLDFSFYNNSSSARTPTLNIVAREYNVEFVKEENTMRRIMSEGSPMPIYPAGSLDNQTKFSKSIDWNTRPISRSKFR